MVYKYKNIEVLKRIQGEMCIHLKKINIQFRKLREPLLVDRIKQRVEYRT